MRAVVNRLLAFVLWVAAALFALFVAIEAANRLAGGDGHVGPLDYESAWQSMRDWNPSGAAESAIFVGVFALGVVLLAFELRSSRGSNTIEVARTDEGTVNLWIPGARRRIRRTLAEQEWIRDAQPTLRIHDGAATVVDRPRTVRPWDDSELATATLEARQELERLGLTVAAVEIAPRAPEGRGTSRTR